MVELPVVVAFIDVLAAIAIHRLAQYRARARNLATRADLYRFCSMMKAAYHDLGHSPLLW